MALTFNQVPDWESWENQGANVATSDLDKDGVPDLIVLRVDHPTPGPNQGFYRIGRKLDANGNITGGWGPWIQIPNWGSNENQGAAVAVADFGVAGLGLVVFQVQHVVPGPNKGFYRVGSSLTSEGLVSEWTDWFEVDWFSWFNQGAGVAIQDLDGNGRPEIIVFQVDNAPQQNAGYYRVAWNLDPLEGGIPALYTYLAQFIDHDITFDPASSLQKQNDPDALIDFRTPAFDLAAKGAPAAATRPAAKANSQRTN